MSNFFDFFSLASSYFQPVFLFPIKRNENENKSSKVENVAENDI